MTSLPPRWGTSPAVNPPWCWNLRSKFGSPRYRWRLRLPNWRSTGEIINHVTGRLTVCVAMSLRCSHIHAICVREQGRWCLCEPNVSESYRTHRHMVFCGSYHSLFQCRISNLYTGLHTFLLHHIEPLKDSLQPKRHRASLSWKLPAQFHRRASALHWQSTSRNGFAICSWLLARLLRQMSVVNGCKW